MKTTDLKNVLPVILLSVFSLTTSCRDDDAESGQGVSDSRLEGQWFVVGKNEITESESTIYPCYDVLSFKQAIIDFKKDGTALVTSDADYHPLWGDYFPWSNGTYHYRIEKAESDSVIIGNLKGEYWFEDNGNVLYIKTVRGEEAFENLYTDICILKRDTEENRNPPFCRRDEQVNLLDKEELADWQQALVVRHKEKYEEAFLPPYSFVAATPPYMSKDRIHRFKLKGKTFYCVYSNFALQYFFCTHTYYTEEGDILSDLNNGQNELNEYELYYNSTDWELVYVFDVVKEIL